MSSPAAGPAKRRRIAVDEGEDSDNEGFMAPRSTLQAEGHEDVRDDQEEIQDEAEEVAEVEAEAEAEREEEVEEEAEPSEDEGEDLMENMEADYIAIPELDQYDARDLDQRFYAPMDFDERRKAEEALEERSRVGGRLDGILDSFLEEDDDARDRRRGQLDRSRPAEQKEEEVKEEEPELNLEAFDVPLREWISQAPTRRELKRRLRKFLNETKDEKGREIYLDAIRHMCAANMASLEVQWAHIKGHLDMVAGWIAEAPKDMLNIFDEVVNEVTLVQFPAYRDIVQDEIHVRIAAFEIIESLRDLRQGHLNQLVRVVGVVTRRTQVMPELKMIMFECACGQNVGPFRQVDNADIHPTSCPHCNGTGPFKVNQEQTVYRNFQKITLQESPGTVPAGRVPRYKEVILTADLIDRARPGEEIEVTGVFLYRHEVQMQHRSGYPVFVTYIEANHIHKREDLYSMLHITDDDKREIRKLARDPKIAKRLLESFATSIHGHEHVKLSLLLSLFGGVEKNVNNKHRTRGDINVLLLGDPGTAKSQLLKYLEKVAPRAVYTTGKGASAVGLTAGVHRDPLTNEWTLEGGALVLADRGMCLIDEFDKMNDSDRTSIHEALEQQSISVSKAGIVTSLQARCSVVAAANPIGGRYDSSLNLSENVELTDPILQRLDILCVLQDVVDPLADERLADFVVGSHMRSRAAASLPPSAANTEGQTPPVEGPADGGAEGQGPGHGTNPIPLKLLTKYIMFARSNVSPQLQELDYDKIEKLYSDLRRESMTSGGVPIAVRHIESLIRMAEAHAKMHLRDHVRDDDVNVAISVMLRSFLNAQKFSVRRALERGYRRYLSQTTDFVDLLMLELQRLLRDAQAYESIRRQHTSAMPMRLEVLCEDLEQKAREYRIYDMGTFYQSETFRRNGMEYDPVRRIIIKQF